MALVPNNILQNVQTYQKSELAWMLNNFFCLKKANKKFVDFENKEANLGSTVTWDLAPRFVAYPGLQVTNQPSTQRLQSMTCSNSQNVTTSYTDQQFIFNVRDYMDRFGEASAIELGSAIEQDVLKNITGEFVVNDNTQSGFGTVLNPASGPYRYFGNGVTPINSFGQLAQAIANFRDYGSSPVDLCGVIPLVDVPAIVNSGLNQFATNRNNEMAKTWELGEFTGCMWYQSNLLPLHISGNVGNATPYGTGNVLTLVSTNDSSGQNVTQLTFSGATINDANAIFNGDVFTFNDGVSGKPNVRYLTFNGHTPSQQPVQCRITAAAGANGSGNVTVNIFPALNWAGGSAINLNVPLQAGMQVTVEPSHRAGLIWSGKSIYIAMPRLPQMEPYYTVAQTDKYSGLSFRHYWGSQLGTGVSKMYIRDVAYGASFVAENQMRLLFPM